MTSRSIKCFECESSSSTLQESSHFDHIPLSPSFYALVPILKHCMVRMSLTCGYREVVDEVEPIALLHLNPWELLLRVAYIAMLIDVVWVSEIHDRCEFVN